MKSQYSQRIDPLGILAPAVKPAVLAASTNAKTAVTSRVENMVVGQCPVCQQTMSRALAEDVAVYVCTPCCVCLPTED